MKKKIIAVILELIPILSAITSFVLIISDSNIDIVRYTIKITILISIIGFVFFFIGRALVKSDKLVKILGILDIFATIYVVWLYVVAFMSIGL